MDKEKTIAKWQKRIKSGIYGIGDTFKGAFDITFNPNNTQFGSLKIYNYVTTIPRKINNILDNLIVENYTPENGGTINNRLREQQLLTRLNKIQQSTYKTPELTGSRELYLNRLKLQGFTARPTTIKNNSSQLNKTSNISFKQAFNNARNSGLKEFTWGGKRFNTKNKGEENYIFSNGKWINPNIKFTVSSIVEPTKEEMDELNRKAKPINTYAGASFAKKGIKLQYKNTIQRFKERKTL